MGAVRAGETIRAPRQRQSAAPCRAAERPALAAGLYLVATPIGNLGDITLRALDILKQADLVACEDTRVTGKLMEHYGIRAKLVPYHDHSPPEARAEILSRIAAGGAVALVSDAGTPLVSDPGYKLLREAAAAGAKIVPVPGASSFKFSITSSRLMPAPSWDRAGRAGCLRAG